jgi:hypothetical protein
MSMIVLLFLGLIVIGGIVGVVVMLSGDKDE